MAENSAVEKLSLGQAIAEGLVAGMWNVPSGSNVKYFVLSCWCCLGRKSVGGGALLEEIYPWGWALRFYSQALLPAHSTS